MENKRNLQGEIDGGLTHGEQDKHLERKRKEKKRKKKSGFRNNGISVLVVLVLLQAQQSGTPAG
jgi:hypothetical protein